MFKINPIDPDLFMLRTNTEIAEYLPMHLPVKEWTSGKSLNDCLCADKKHIHVTDFQHISQEKDHDSRIP